MNLNTITITDNDLADVKYMAYNIGLRVSDSDGSPVLYSPKKFPTKAVDILFIINSTKIEIYLDPTTLTWKSRVKDKDGNMGQLSDAQLEQFFKTEFYTKMINKFQMCWSLTDTFYGKLFEFILKCKPKPEHLQEDSNKKEDSRANNEHIKSAKFTKGGRRIDKFSDLSIDASTIKGYCWPSRGNEFNPAQWKNWKAINPICKMTFVNHGIKYGISISAFDHNFKNRGFRGYRLGIGDEGLAWLTIGEIKQICKTQVFKKFIDFCVRRIKNFINLPSNVIFDKITDNSKLELADIEKTKYILYRDINSAFIKYRADNYRTIGEDAIIAPSAAPTGIVAPTAPTTGVGDVQTVAHGTTDGDVLGHCDHTDDGYFGDGCFHLPKSVFKDPFPRIKKNKKKHQ